MLSAEPLVGRAPGPADDESAPDLLSQVRIRPVAPADADTVGRFVRALSMTSRQRRFHAGLRELSPELLARFTAPDERQERALVATVIEQGQVRCIGEARYAVDPDAPGAREFALVIADEWQQRGLGRLMLCSLIVEALGQGVRILFGDVLRDNLPMLGLARALGFTRRRHPADPGLLRVVRALDAGAGPSPCRPSAGVAPA